MKIVNVAVDAAIAEMKKHRGLDDFLCKIAREVGIAAGDEHMNKLVDRILWNIGQMHDTSELWSHMRRDSEMFRHAVRMALNGDIEPPKISSGTS